MENDPREKITKALYKRYAERLSISTINNITDSILSLLDAQRCVWTYDTEREWVTSCGEEIPDGDTYEKYPFCPKCGRRIEVKDAG